MARIALVTLLLAALVAGSTAFYSESILEEAVADAQRALAAYLPPARAEPPMSRLMVKYAGTHELAGGPSCACKNCTRESARWVMDHVIDYIKEKCETTECPVLQKMCDKAKAHPKVAFGFLVAAVRPMSLGYAWCNGKGECGEEEETEAADLEADVLSVGESVAQLQQLVQHEPAPAGELVAEVEAANMVSALEDGIDMLVDGEAEEPNSVCKGCIKVTSTIVIWDTVHKIKHYCHKTESKMVKKHCKMAYKHPQEAFGYLVYKVRPGEWACGFCFGNKMCSADAPVDTLRYEALYEMAESDGMAFATLGEEDEDEDEEEVALELPH